MTIFRKEGVLPDAAFVTDFTTFRHYHDHNNHDWLGSCTLEISIGHLEGYKDELLSVKAAFCSPKDNFCYRTGRNIAHGRRFGTLIRRIKGMNLTENVYAGLRDAKRAGQLDYLINGDVPEVFKANGRVLEAVRVRLARKLIHSLYNDTEQTIIKKAR